MAKNNGNNGLIPGAEAGYYYDTVYRQPQKLNEANIQKKIKLKKKIVKLSKKNKNLKRK